MTQPLIVLGDTTSHGGVVISGDATWTIEGKPVAKVQDLTVCPRCKGIFPITSGASDLMSMGQAVARQGDMTACGATLIAAQRQSYWGAEADLALAKAACADDTPQGAQAVAIEVPGLCLECLKTAAANGTALVIRS